MNDAGAVAIIILLLGAMIILNILTKSALKRIGVPSLIGYIALGLIVRLLDLRWELLAKEAMEVFEVFASIGIIVLLFRVGLESKIAGLTKQLRHASIIWIGNVLVSGAFGLGISLYVLALDIIPSLFIATALTATSVGVSIAVWQEAKATNSANGEMLIDVAEMDDISGIILMALLFSMVPALAGSRDLPWLPVLARMTGLFLIKFLALGTFCALFALYAARPLVKFFEKFKTVPDPMLLVAGCGLMIAAMAGLLGFSVAIGAFFAGLIFSEDPDSIQIDEALGSLYELFVPFFFIGIGLHIDPGTLAEVTGMGSILLVAAVLGKLIGGGGFALATTGVASSILIGVSLIPRAEIAMVIMQKGLTLGPWAVPPQVFSAMVLVSVMTCVISPFILRPMLLRWPQKGQIND